MKAIQKWGDGREGMGVREVPEPKVGPNDLLVEVGAVGICGSDLHIWRDEKEHRRPVTLGGIIGSGVADFKAYIDKVLELGIEKNCKRHGEACIAGIEMGARGGFVDDADRWVQESLNYLAKILPELSR